MRIIDEKGRLFGKINVIDFLVILFLLFLIPMFYFGYKIMIKKPVVKVPEREFVKIETNSQLVKLKPEVLEAISVGDKELDDNGQVIGEIIGLGQSEPYRYEFDIGAGQKIVEDDSGLRQIEAKLKLKVRAKQDSLYYKDTLIKIGLPLQFRSDKYSIVAILLEEPERIEDRTIVLYITLKGLDEDMLKEVSVGDKELDENGKTIAEILNLGKIENSSLKFNLGGGNFTRSNDSDKKQISAKIKLKCQVKNNNQLYFKGKKITHDTPIEFKTDRYKVTGLLTETFKEEKENEGKAIDLYITLKGLDEDTLKEVSVGDKEVNENGETIAEILSLGRIENSSLEFNLGSGNFVMGQDSSRRQISTKMRLKVQVKNGNRLYFKGEKVENNRFLEFKTDEYKVIGLIAKAFEVTSPIKEKWVSLEVKFSGVVPEVGYVVQKGDIEKNAFEKTIAKIGSVISNRPSEVLTLKEDEFITLNHPFNKDILASLDVLSVEKEGVYYYKNYPIKMGNNITFATDLYSISGTIIGLEIK